MLGLPAHITTCLFDLDGVLTQTAQIHAQAWKEMFDDFLRDWADRQGEPFEPFDRPTDYDE
jgi:beta-phosphoglucomutase-like phosphatase (HAD superfamily)